jgi:hypothetical protein
MALPAATAAGAASDACREWWGEHRTWKAEVVHRHLAGAGQRELDEAVFELLQREAWLTSCERSARQGRARLVGWKLIGRLPEDYSAAVVEVLLEQGGFDLSLRSVVPGRGEFAGSSASAPR